MRSPRAQRRPSATRHRRTNPAERIASPHLTGAASPAQFSGGGVTCTRPRSDHGALITKRQVGNHTILYAAVVGRRRRWCPAEATVRARAAPAHTRAIACTSNGDADHAAFALRPLRDTAAAAGHHVWPCLSVQFRRTLLARRRRHDHEACYRPLFPRVA
jgi:hypothetical protein